MRAAQVILAMRIEPTGWQTLSVLAGLALLLAGLIAAQLAFAKRSQASRWLGLAAVLGAMLTNLAVVLYRNLLARWSCPIEDNFDSLLLFVVMLGGLLFYLGRMGRRPDVDSPPARRSAVDLILLPLMIAMQLAAASMYFGGFRQFAFAGAWRPIHLGSLLIALLLVTAAAAAAVMFLLLDSALRHKDGGRVIGAVPSLERLDRLMHRASAGALALLAVSVFTGVLIIWQAGGQGLPVVKLLAAALACLVYVAVLSVRLAPRMRGRLTAWLCILGLAMVLLAYVAMHWQ